MIVVGFDLSLTSSGVTVIADDIPTTHTVKSAPESDPLAVWKRIRFTAARCVRFVPPSALVVVEWASYGSKFGQQDERAAQRWLVTGTLLAAGHAVVRVAPGTRAKYATGDGKADKAAVKAAMRERHPSVSIPNGDVADSLALAAMGARFVGAPIDGVPSKQQIEAMRAVRWPEMGGTR